MGVHISVSDIISDASQLSDQDLETLVGQLNLLRAKRAFPTLSKGETELMMKINEGFSLEKWVRLAALDEKMEIADLSNAEAEESLSLAQELEAYTVERFKYMKTLAEMRGVSIDYLMEELGIIPQNV